MAAQSGDVIRVKIRYFAQAREFAGVKEEVIEFNRSTSASDVLEKINAVHPGMSAAGDLLVVINGVFSATERKMNDGDVLAVVPPIAGG